MAITKDDEILKRGMKIPEIINPSDTLLQTLEKYTFLPISKVDYGVSPMELKDALYDAKKFLNYYYKLQKVPTVTIKKVLGHEVHFGRTINPLSLAIKLYDSGDIFSGYLTEVLTKDKIHILFTDINLSQEITEQTSASYVHEITHTQVDHLVGSVNDYYNVEVLSVFNELFHASILDKDEKILRLNDARRIYEMSISAAELRNHHDGISEIERDELLDCCKYLVSDLKAYNLFTLFYYGNDSLKNNILDGIQEVFDGYLTVEELLERFNITYENSQNNERVLTYFKR